MTALREIYVRDIAQTYRNQKALVDRAIAQVSDDDLHAVIDPDANSIAVIVKHVAGNLRSRFTDFLTTDGEKPTRNRDAEFTMPTRVSRADMLQEWEAAWAVALGAIDALGPADLERTIYIRGEAFIVIEVLHRLVTHTAYHAGQIVLLARHLKGPEWSSLSIPRDQSAGFPGTFKTGFVPRLP